VKLASLIVLTGALVGCVTVGSDVIPVGKDTYQMSMTGVGFATQANTNIKALKAANDYCAKLGKHMVPKTSAESGVYVWSPRQNNLVFMCLDANDPRYVHPEAVQSAQPQ
jgi:hypothetical protein